MRTPINAERPYFEAVLDDIEAVITGAQYTYANEAQLQELLEVVLLDAGLRAVREVPLGHGRVDFLVGRVGVEVKVDGALSTVRRQLHRYAKSKVISALLLVTNRARHAALSGEIDGKPVRVVGVVNPF